MTKEEFMFAVANDLVNEIVLQLERNGSVDSGDLKKNIDIIITGDTVEIQMEEYWEFLEYGTKPHLIVPKDKKALKFEGPNGPVFAKVVHHPGNAPKPFLRPAIHMHLQKIIKDNEDLLNEQ